MDNKKKPRTVQPLSKLGNELLTLIRDSQEVDDTADFEKVSSKMEDLYKKMAFEEFFAVYQRCLTISLLQQEDTTADNVLELLAYFAVKFVKEDMIESLRFLKKLMNLLQLGTMNKRLLVRRKSCQFLAKLTRGLDDIDTDIYNVICSMMTEILEENNPDLKIDAARVLYRLQSTDDPKCPVVKIFYDHALHDSSSIVRKTLVRMIALSTDKMDTFISITCDRNRNVRKAAYEVMKTVPHDYLTVKQRTNLLSNGLADTCKNVRQVVKQGILKSWIEQCEQNHLVLLVSLDTEGMSQKILDLILSGIFEASNAKLLSNDLAKYLKKTRLIPFNKLTVQTVLFWRFFLTFYAGSMEDVVRYFNMPGVEEMMAEGTTVTLLPELVHLCEYIKVYYLDDPKVEEEALWQRNEREFKLLQLLRIVELCDLKNEVGRKKLNELLYQLLMSDYLYNDSINPIMQLYSKSNPYMSDIVKKIMEIVNNLYFDETDENQELESPLVDVHYDASEEASCYVEGSEETPKECTINELVKKASLDKVMKSMHIIYELMQLNITKLSPALITLFEEIVLSVSKLYRTDVKVIPIWTMTMCSFCLRDFKLAQKYMNTIGFSISHNLEVAVKCLFDLFARYDHQKLPYPGSYEDINVLLDEWNEDSQLHPTLAMLIKLADHPDDFNVREECILGICKLFLARKIHTPTALSKILIFYANPIGKRARSSPGLRANIPKFLELFVKDADYVFEISVKAFIIALKDFAENSIEPPPNEVDMKKFLTLLSNLINQIAMHCENKEEMEIVIFNSIIEICNEVEETESLIARKMYLTTLTLLDMSEISSSKLPAIDHEVKGFCKTFMNCEDASLVSIIRKLNKKVEELIGPEPSNEKLFQDRKTKNMAIRKGNSDKKDEGDSEEDDASDSNGENVKNDSDESDDENRINAKNSDEEDLKDSDEDERNSSNEYEDGEVGLVKMMSATRINSKGL